MSDKTALAAGLKIIGLTLLIDYYYIYGKKFVEQFAHTAGLLTTGCPKGSFFI